MPSSLPVLLSLPVCPAGGTGTGSSARSLVAALPHSCPLFQTLWSQGRVLSAQSQGDFITWHSFIPYTRHPLSTPARAPHQLDTQGDPVSPSTLTLHHESPSWPWGKTKSASPSGRGRRGMSSLGKRCFGKIWGGRHWAGVLWVGSGCVALHWIASSCAMEHSVALCWVGSWCAVLHCIVSNCGVMHDV